MTRLRWSPWRAALPRAVLLVAALLEVGCGGLALAPSSLGPAERDPTTSALNAPRGVIGQGPPPAPSPSSAPPPPYPAPPPYYAPAPAQGYPPGQWNPHGAYAPYGQPGAAPYPQGQGIAIEPKRRFQSVEAMAVGFVSLGLAVLCGLSAAFVYAENVSGSSKFLQGSYPAWGIAGASFTLLGGTLVLYGVQTPE